MPLKVRVVTDHIIDGDENSLTPTMVRSAISELYTPIGHWIPEVKINGIKIKCDNKPLSHHLQRSTEDPVGHLRSLEVIQPHFAPLFLKLRDSLGKISRLPIISTYTVQEVKETIERQHAISADKQILSIDGQELDNQENLSDLMVSRDKVVQLAGFRLTGPITFNVHTPRGENLIIQGHTSDTIKDLKVKLEELEKIPVDEQRIVSGGYLLDDHIILGHYGIGAGSVVSLFGRLRGCDCGCGKDKYYLYVELTCEG